MNCISVWGRYNDAINSCRLPPFERLFCLISESFFLSLILASHLLSSTVQSMPPKYNSIKPQSKHTTIPPDTKALIHSKCHPSAIDQKTITPKLAQNFGKIQVHRIDHFLFETNSSLGFQDTMHTSFSFFLSGCSFLVSFTDSSIFISEVVQFQSHSCVCHM